MTTSHAANANVIRLPCVYNCANAPKTQAPSAWSFCKVGIRAGVEPGQHEAAMPFKTGCGPNSSTTSQPMSDRVLILSANWTA